MPAEILNIEYHTRRLLLRALNKHKFKTRAFAALGVSEKQGYNLIKLHEVRWSRDRGYYSDKVIEIININICHTKATDKNQSPIGA